MRQMRPTSSFDERQEETRGVRISLTFQRVPLSAPRVWCVVTMPLASSPRHSGSVEQGVVGSVDSGGGSMKRVATRSRDPQTGQLEISPVAGALVVSSFSDRFLYSVHVPFHAIRDTSFLAKQHVVLKIISALFTVALALPQGYNVPTPIGPGIGIGGPIACANGEVLGPDGLCVLPEVTRKIYVYGAPQVDIPVGPPPVIPPPRVEYQIVFIRAPEAPPGSKPFIIPPPQQKTLLYVLSKRPEAIGPEVIEVDAPAPTGPEVYYVNYGEGENPTLPGGIDLQTALGSAAAQTGGIIGGGGGFGGGFDGGFGAGGAIGGGGGAIGGVIGGGGAIGGGAIGGFGGDLGLGGASFDDSGEITLLPGIPAGSYGQPN
ncbi:uncharacterized protein LOC143017618 [Oratosquilla oratoria]|uniref:uncharacterized protein LOC143017618 n=1 Tax=Oratosquilla oratoria TaxID=337810 RepID=UPI003F76732F